MKNFSALLKNCYRKYFYNTMRLIEKITASTLSINIGYFFTKRSCFLWLGIPYKHITVHSLNPLIINCDQTHKRKPPKTIRGEIPPSFSIEQGTPSKTFVVSLENGISSPCGANLTSEADFIIELSEQFGKKEATDHHLFKLRTKKLFPKIKHYKNSVVSIAAKSQHNYFHWLFDVLPRLHLANESGIPFDKVYVEYNTPIQKETLKLLGYNSKDIIEAEQGTYISASLLIVPSFLFYPRDDIHTWGCRFLRERFLPHIKVAQNKTNATIKKIYISRKDATRRMVINEEDIIELLNNYGFTAIELTGKTFLEQAKIFNDADIIVAPHGAAMANLVFCKPDTKVIELFAPEYMHKLYWDLSQAVGLDYYYLRGEDNNAYKSGDPCYHDIKINIADLTSILAT